MITFNPILGYNRIAFFNFLYKENYEQIFENSLTLQILGTTVPNSEWAAVSHCDRDQLWGSMYNCPRREMRNPVHDKIWAALQQYHWKCKLTAYETQRLIAFIMTRIITHYFT